MKKILLGIGIFAVAFLILFISIFDSSVITYPKNLTPVLEGTKVPSIDYPLPTEGKVLPDSPFWKVKALRDRIWFEMTTSHLRKAQLALLFADKRLVMAETLYGKGEKDLALVTLTKAEKYLPIASQEESIARAQGVDTNTFLMQLSLASLKHKEVVERMIQLAPVSDKSQVAQIESYANDVYKSTVEVLNSKGIPVSKDPFDRDL